MTPLQINIAARQRYNAVNDDFWSDAEMYNSLYEACCEMATEGFVIEQTYTTTSVASQQEYSFPTEALNIKRITYDGRKLVPITFREDDVLTVLDQTTTATGTPTSYAMWNKILYLRPTPGTSALTIKVWANIEPQTITAASTLEIPTSFQMSLVNFALAEMSAKNKNYVGAEYYRGLWEKALKRIVKFNRKRKIGDAFNFVKNVDLIPQTDLGNV